MQEKEESLYVIQSAAKSGQTMTYYFKKRNIMQFPALTVCNVTCKVYTSLLAKTYFLLYLLRDLGSDMNSKSTRTTLDLQDHIPPLHEMCCWYPQKEKKKVELHRHNNSLA